MANSDVACCIIIPSHVSLRTNVDYFDKCLDSLAKQTITIPIYLSISFDNNDLKIKFNATIKKCNMVNVTIRENKASQISHIKQAFNEIKHKYDWYLFCDDDDTYNQNRVEVFVLAIQALVNHQKENPTKICAGAHEDINQESHSTKRVEYWQYVVNKNILDKFFDGLKNYNNIIDHKFCDIVFVEFLRRLDDSYLFCIIPGAYYNYNINNHSITGQIQINKHALLNDINETTDLTSVIKLFNDDIDKKMDGIYNNIFYSTVSGHNLEYGLKRSFEIKLHPLLKFIDQNKINKLKKYHNSIKLACQQIYQTGFVDN